VLPSLKIWLNHFEYHSDHHRSIGTDVPHALSSGERAAIASSIATFQLGEQSDGQRLLRAAQRFAVTHAAPELPRIIELLIREEQRHAQLLGAFMDSQGIARKRHDWTDRVFRALRRLAGFELAVHVLTTAELIGIVYYRALESATRCEPLRLLCRMLVADELAHVGFEAELLHALRGARPRWQRALQRLVYRAFFASAVLVVWLTHRKVLRRGGYHLGSFRRSCRTQSSFYLRPWPSEPVSVEAQRKAA